MKMKTEFMHVFETTILSLASKVLMFWTYLKNKLIVKYMCNDKINCQILLVIFISRLPRVYLKSLAWEMF